MTPTTAFLKKIALPENKQKIFFKVKTHLQSKASREIAVGYQHNHRGTFTALANIFRKDGIRGLWRGATASLPRVGVGSAAQLSTFSTAKEFLQEHMVNIFYHKFFSANLKKLIKF